MLASVTPLPVIGVPVPLTYLDGMDSLLSIVQMPAGVPVATVSIGGARNAGLLAARIVGTGRRPSADVREQMVAFQADLRDQAHAKGASLREQVAAACGLSARGLRQCCVGCSSDVGMPRQCCVGCSSDVGAVSAAWGAAVT